MSPTRSSLSRRPPRKRGKVDPHRQTARHHRVEHLGTPHLVTEEGQRPVQPPPDPTTHCITCSAECQEMPADSRQMGSTRAPRTRADGSNPSSPAGPPPDADVQVDTGCDPVAPRIRTTRPNLIRDGRFLARRAPTSCAVEHLRRRGYPQELAQEAVKEASAALSEAPSDVRRDPFRALVFVRVRAESAARRLWERRFEYLCQRGYPADIAEDAVQEAYLVLATAPPEVCEDSSRARAYLFASADHIAQRMSKTRGRFRSFEAPDGQPNPEVERALLDEAVADSVMTRPDCAIEELERCREISLAHAIVLHRLPQDRDLWEAEREAWDLFPGRQRRPRGQAESACRRQARTRARQRAKYVLKAYGFTTLKRIGR